MRFSLFGIIAMVIILYVGYKWGNMVFPKVGL
jgi:hypothetical protein